MNGKILRSLGFVVVLGCVGLSLHAQRGNQRPPPPDDDDRCYCLAEGAECLFGDANGCHVSCPDGLLCDCRGASCSFGFPRASRCRCVAPPMG